MDALRRKLLVIAAVIFAIAAPSIQAVAHLGLSAAEFASDGNGTLRAAGYAFSIWGLIYLSLIAYATWQALPRNDDDPLVTRVAIPSTIAIAGCGLWICASALNWRWASVVIILASAAALTRGLLKAARQAPLSHGRDWLFAWAPLGLLAGWLTIASALNILTVLTAEGLLMGIAKPAAFLGIAVVMAVTLLVLRMRRLTAYGAPISWGLVAVWVAERSGKPDVAGFALSAAIVIAAFGLWQARATAAGR